MNNISSISVHTLGCKLNQAESEGLARELTNRGFSIIAGNKADAFIINSCSVTHAADGKSRHLVRMLRALNPDAMIAVTGCYAERAGQELILCGADMICGNSEKKLMAGLLAAKQPQRQFNPPEKQTGRVRSFIKVQDGCDKFCSYCIVPFVRTALYSADADSIVSEIESRTGDGYKEVVLTGTEIGSYCSNGLKLIDLIKLILRDTSISRLRLSSLQPQDITDELLSLWQDRRLCGHFHMALQSGSDRVLKRMRRRYATDIFRKAVESARAAVPDASVTTDIIVGFPGESEQEFNESLEFCYSMKFAALHIFPYSARQGTAAAQMTDKVDEKVKKQRCGSMLELAAGSADEFARRFIGETKEVLWEKEVRQGSGIYSGLTDNYIRVYARSKRDITNTISDVGLIDHAGHSGPSFVSKSKSRKYGGLWGELIA